MSTEPLHDDPRAQRGLVLGLTFLAHAVAAPIPLLAWFFWSYAFRDSVTVGMQVSFVVGVVAIGAALGLVVGLLAAGATRGRVGVWTSYGVASGVAFYLVVLAAGTVVSLANNGNGSVTADQPAWAFFLLVVALVLSALGLSRVALRSLERATARRAA